MHFDVCICQLVLQQQTNSRSQQFITHSFLIHGSVGQVTLCWAQLGFAGLGPWLQSEFRSTPIVLILGTGLKEQPFSGACYSGDRAQKLKRMSRNMEFLLNPSLGPGTMPLLPTFFLFHAKLVFIFSFTYGAPKMLGIYIVCQ